MTKGLEIAQQGIDVSHALDSQKVLDSRWRYFEILQEKLITLPTLVQSGAQVIYNHALGFLPPFEVYDTVLKQYISSGDSLGRGLVADKQNIYFNGIYTDNGWSNHQVLIRVYNTPFTAEYSAPIQQTFPSVSSTPSKTGIKIVDTGTDYRELELSRFHLNTTGKSFAIQKTGLTTANTGTNFLATIQHNLGHPPTFLATYVDFNLQWVAALNPDFLPAKGTADGVNLTFKGIQSVLTGTLAYIIFKEFSDFSL